MYKTINAFSIMAGLIGGICVHLFGRWDIILQTLVIMIVLDYITGIIKAIYKKELSSEVGFKGVLKKVLILVVVIVSNVLQNLTGNNVAVREVVIMFYIANEGISLLENVAEFTPLPEKLKEVLKQLRGDIE